MAGIGSALGMINWAAAQLPALWRDLLLCLCGQADQETQAAWCEHWEQTCLLLKHSEIKRKCCGGLSSLETQEVSLDGYTVLRSGS